ncbi:Na/Pi symporter [Metabacillus arenae]|uniref:Na/Pi symporter n=1 Tax=Metabacillus arenae TaxID=2771434 RepID=UPI0037C81CE8
MYLICGFIFLLFIFLAGMMLLRNGLVRLSEEKIRTWLVFWTDHPIKGFLAGILFTGILQSSSAFMVIVIGFVTAGLLTFKQTIGLILGTNIGSTFTTEMITLDLDYLILPLFIIGLLGMLSKNPLFYGLGSTFVGLGSIFGTMWGFSHFAEPLTSLNFVHSFLLSANEHSLFGIAGGTVVTAIIHSSAATTGIVMSFMNEHILNLSAGIAFVLGANIGTCITAVLASVGANKEARLTALAHVWVNLIGVALFLPFIEAMSPFVQDLAESPDLQLAHFSLLFNVISSLAILPFADVFSKFVLFTARLK